MLPIRIVSRNNDRVNLHSVVPHPYSFLHPWQELYRGSIPLRYPFLLRENPPKRSHVRDVRPAISLRGNTSSLDSFKLSMACLCCGLRYTHCFIVLSHLDVLKINVGMSCRFFTIHLCPEVASKSSTSFLCPEAASQSSGVPWHLFVPCVCPRCAAIHFHLTSIPGMSNTRIYFL